MKIKAKITKKFAFELSNEDISAIRRISSLIEEIKKTIYNHDIETGKLTNANTEDWIAYDDLIIAKRVLDFLEDNKKINIEENLILKGYK